MIDDIVDVAWKVAVALEHAGIAYYLGGSVASSLQATARTTNDIDFVVALLPGQVAAFAKELGPEFEVDQEALVEAARRAPQLGIVGELAAARAAAEDPSKHLQRPGA